MQLLNFLPTAPGHDNDERERHNVTEVDPHTFTTALVCHLIADISVIGFGILSIAINVCPIQKLIPIYLIVVGSTQLLLDALIVIISKHENNIYKCILISISTFQIVWSIFGATWVYGIFELKLIFSNKFDCNFGVYSLAFVLVTIDMIVATLTILILCCALCLLTINCLVPEEN